MAYFNYKNFPCLTRFVKSYLSNLADNDPAVFGEFLQKTGCTEEQGRKALEYGYIPTIRLKPLGGYGFTPVVGDEIHFNQKVARGIEAVLDVSVVNGVFNIVTNRSNVLKLFEATIMHELVHWCRRRMYGVATSARARGQEEFIAQEFEKKAYGSFQTVRSLNLTGLVDEPGR